MAHDEVEGLRQALEEARKRAESAEEMVLHEREEAKATEDLREAREFADAANIACVSAKGDVDTLRAVMGNMQRELEEAQASEEAPRSECQHLMVLA